MSETLSFVEHFTNVLNTQLTALAGKALPTEIAHQSKIKDVRQQVEVAALPEIKAALQGVLKSLEENPPDAAAVRRQEIAQAVLEAAQALNLPLQLVGTPAASDTKRTPKVEMDKLVEAISAAIPRDTPLSAEEIAEKIQADVAVTRSAIQRLKREGKLTLDGARGRAGLWKLI